MDTCSVCEEKNGNNISYLEMLLIVAMLIITTVIILIVLARSKPSKSSMVASPEAHEIYNNVASVLQKDKDANFSKLKMRAGSRMDAPLYTDAKSHFNNGTLTPQVIDTLIK